MKITNAEAFNFESAIRGMRNPMNSWDNSDSDYSSTIVWTKENKDKYKYYFWDYCIGPNDMSLCKKLINAGNEHRKFLRQIFVSMDITAPIFWWKEMDTYKVGTTTNSTSTMHKITAKEFDYNDFEIDDYDPRLLLSNDKDDMLDYYTVDIIKLLNNLRNLYIETKDKRYWKELIRWLPESYLQTRTWTADYETLRNIYHQRKNHKLTEWHTFCEYIKYELPYGEEFIAREE